MLSPSEKAYCRALLALKQGDFQVAAAQFGVAAEHFHGNTEFNLLKETTALLLAVRDERRQLKADDEIEIAEVYSDG
jgi:hypothetical protein